MNMAAGYLTENVIAGMTYDQILWYFLIYAFLGWVVEVAYHAICNGKVVNRGFLNGPMCPIYGFGMLGVLMVAYFLPGGDVGKPHALALFAAGIVMTTSIELFGGWVLDAVFHARWWDYSNERYNFHGYICLKFSIFWGLGVVFMVRIFHPFLETFWNLPQWLNEPLLGISYIVTLSDFVLTVATIQGMNKTLKELDEIRATMRIPSDAMTVTIAENAMALGDTLERGRLQASLAKADLKDAMTELQTGQTDEEKSQAVHTIIDIGTEGAKGIIEFSGQAVKNATQKNVQKMMNLSETGKKRWEELKAQIDKRPVFGMYRLLRAFPDMKHRDYEETVKELQREYGAEEPAESHQGKTE